MKKFFIGIDFSKEKFDSAIYQVESKQIILQDVFENNLAGYALFIKWIRETTTRLKSSILFCGEHTGYYSANLSVFLHKKGYELWLVPGLQVKLSQGIKRKKSDKVDACKIAEFAFRHHDQINLFKPHGKNLEEIRDLLSFRERLIGMRKVLTVSSKEIKRVRTSATCNSICCESLDYIKALNESIQTCEQQILTLIENDLKLITNFKLLNSITGIGFVNAVLILTATSNFTTTTNPRKFGFYCGVVPFEYSSGSSIRGKSRVSKFANKNIKTKLTLAAQNSIRYDPQMREYYLRKTSEGKSHWLVLNNVKNKLIHRMFAVVRDGKMYDQNYVHPLKQIDP